MNVGEVYGLFQSLVDDTDQTFLTAANTDTYLKAGYSDFRQKVSAIDPGYFVERTHMLLSTSADKFDLTAGANFTDAKPVLGATAVANNKLMSRLVRIGVVDGPGGGSAGTDTLSYYLVPTNTALEVTQGVGFPVAPGIKRTTRMRPSDLIGMFKSLRLITQPEALPPG